MSIERMFGMGFEYTGHIVDIHAAAANSNTVAWIHPDGQLYGAYVADWDVEGVFPASATLSVDVERDPGDGTVWIALGTIITPNAGSSTRIHYMDLTRSATYPDGAGGTRPLEEDDLIIANGENVRFTVTDAATGGGPYTPHFHPVVWRSPDMRDAPSEALF